MNIKNILKNKEVKNAGWIIGGKIAQMVISFIVSILTARYLGPSNYGLIGYASAFVVFFSSLCTLGINSVIIKDFVDNPDEQGEAIGSAILLRAVSSFLSAVMVVGIVGIVDRNEPTTIIVTALCSLGLVFQIFDTVNYWFQSQYKSKITSIATFLAYIIVSGYKILLLIFGANVKWFALATSVDYIAVAVFLLLAYKKHGGQRFKFTKRKAKQLLSSSYHYILSGMMIAVYAQTDKFMLKQMLDETVVGYYSTAVTVCTMWCFVLQAVIDSIYPTILTLHGKDKIAFDRKNRQLYAITFYMSLAVSVLFMFFGTPVIKILYGEAYLPAVNVLKIVTWYTAFSYLGVARNAWIVAEGKQKYLKYIYTVAALLNVIINFALIPVMGAEGAALASLITQVLTSIVLPLFIKELRPNAKLMLEAIILKGIK